MTQTLQLDLTVAQRIATLLRQHQHTVAVVESSSGGLIAASLLAVPGASRYFRGGAVVYTRESRQALVGLTDDDMVDMRSASEPYAQRIASIIRDKHQATWGLAETGAAGPTGNRYGDAAGHTCIAIDGPAGQSLTFETNETDRGDNMVAFAERALGAFEAVLKSAQS